MLPTQVSYFSELFTPAQIAVYIVLAAGCGVLIYFASIKFLLVFQQCGYHGKRYFKWLKSSETPYLSRLMLLCLLGFLFFCVLNVCFSPVLKTFFGDAGNSISSYIGFFSLILFVVVYINTESSVNAKIPLKKTKRLVRLAITYIILLTAITFGFMVLLNYIAYLIKDEIIAILRFSLLCGMPILSPYILFLAYGVNEPLETLIRRHYIRGATDKLNKADVLKIGITGSYGKTSVKEILKTLLSQKFRVLATPESFNTPLGIALTVKNLDNTTDVFIAEMGARYKGDIKELTKIVKPQYGVITGINSQHLETFGNLENTKSTKYELFESLGKDGAGFFSSDNVYSKEMYDKFGGEKYLAGLNEPSFAHAENIVTDRFGTKFDLVLGEEKPVECSTVLLGKHSISNICLAAMVAYKAGMTPIEISQGINRLQCVGHRLELVPNNKGIVLIDDSYNSNVDGINAAMEVLDIFSGRKIVVTPGLVELGKEENVANFNFGKTLAGHADVVVIVGRHNAETLINGLTEGGMALENIKFGKNTKRGNDVLNEMLKEGDVVLFENDLPDNYN